MELLETWDPETVLAIKHDWQIWARDEQLAPVGSWFVWLVLAGRGFGKTRTGAEWVLERVRSGQARRIALVGPTAADVRDTMVEGESGILACAHPGERPTYKPSKGTLVFPNGARAKCFPAVEPERLRGPQHDTAWCDELATWRYPATAWSNLELGLRRGDPRVCVTTTPRPIPLLRELLLDTTTRISRGSTYDNAANLARRFLARLRRRHEGTRLGRQELYAELLEDTPGALWTLALLERNRVEAAPDLARVAVAVDPQAADPNRENADDEKDAETGIIGGGVDEHGNGYLLADASGHYTPGDWGERTVLLHDELRADFVVAEINNGGAMVPFVVQSAAEKLHREGTKAPGTLYSDGRKRASAHIVVKVVHASRGKHTRAEPIAALDEQGRIRHVGYFAGMEPQMTTWVPGQKSPDRLDARVWLFTALMLAEGVPADAGDWTDLFQEAGLLR